MSESMKSIVITGMGAVTPLGIGVDEYWKNLIDGQCGIETLTSFENSDIPVSVGGLVKGFTPENYIPHAQVGKMALFSQYAYAAACEAIADSGITIDPARTGLVMGTAMNGIAEICATESKRVASNGKVSPRFVPKVLGNMAAFQIANAHNITGPSLTLNTACASGADAIGLSRMLLDSNAADVMLAVGGEMIFCEAVASSLSQARALSRATDPKTACRPFDMGRSGFVMSEGGGCVVLETEEHALARGAHIYAEVLGYANNNDAYHTTAPRPDGERAAACMESAIENAGISPEQIGYINAHGTATAAGDTAECAALHKVFGENVPPVSSTKGATGHLMGAGGITEIIACVLAMRDSVLPPTLNIEHQDSACDIDCIPNHARSAAVKVAMSNAFGFGGQNAVVIVGKYEG